MELPQPRPYGSQGRKPTHDFLSLYSPAQQDPRPSQGGILKTHDFLQQGERAGTEDISKDENGAKQPTEKSRPLIPPPTTTSMEHILPGGIAAQQAQASSSDRNDGNSNCSSYTGSGFTLWDESATMNKGQTGKENNFVAKERHAVREAGVHVGGQWETSRERPSQSSSSHSFLNKAFSSLSSSQQSFSKKQSFMDMIKSAKGSHEDEDEDDDVFVIKKEPSPHNRGNMSIKVDGTDTDQKPNTARSKHSATEQRRRSKINDRFQMLRGLIPHGDQKRDKASFLLEVIEYIQFLQEKVHKYEDPYHGWSHEPPKIIPWQKKGHRTVEDFGDQSGGTKCVSGPASGFAAKYDGANTNVSSTMPLGVQGLIDHDISTADTSREMGHHRRPTENGLPLSLPLQQTMYSHEGSSSASVLLPPRLTSNTEIGTSQSHPELWQRKPCTIDSTTVSEKLKGQEVTIESGTISISSVYSQGLLNTLTQSLQSSGVDLSHASISVQIDIGNRANSALNPLPPIVQTNNLPCNNQTMLQPRLPSGGGESEQAFKRLKTGRS
ncbi:transcription factor BIM1 [Heracleum sosnowskyi]|uniref:Transcription factor BIM1 n=1 Tax=Heracleum sosnowskyi TaxID=360622 RepID=A0AAD8JMA0_9APIA|nr:transcription factor BIM1 [Heracleum sosnowskyi]